MSDGLFSAPIVQGLRLTLDESQIRQQAIASNLANINTPGYQRMDVSQVFSQAYKDALSKLQDGEDVAPLPDATIAAAEVQGAARPDGNTVQLEPEMVNLSQNGARFQFASEMLTNSYHGIKYAITGSSSF